MKPRPLKFWILVPGAGLLLLYIGLTFAAWWFVREVRHVEAVTYADIALPTRWPHYQIIRGHHHIATGLKLLEQGQGSAGFQQLRMGLARAPRHRDGRLALAALLAQAGRADLAESVLTDGLPYHRNDPGYITPLLDFLAQQGLDSKILALTRPLIADPSLDPATRDLAAFRAAQAAAMMGNYDAAERLLVQNHLQTLFPGPILLAQLEWQRGYHELALVMLRSLATEFPGNEAIYSQLATYLAEAQCDDELRSRAIIHQLSHPESIRSHLDQLHALAKTSETTARQKTIEQTFNAFQTSPAALLLLADYAATNGEVALADRIAAHFTAQAWTDAPAAHLMAIEAKLVRGDYATALTASEALLAEPNLNPHYQQIATGFLSLAYYGTGDPVAGYTKLASLMNQTELRADTLLGMAKRLIIIGRVAPARDLLAHAVKLDPRNQAALTRLLELDLDNGNLPAIATNLRALTQMQRPSPIVLKRAQAQLSSDTCLFLPERAALLSLVANTLPR